MELLTTIHNHALYLLSQREHTKRELQNKLIAKGFSVEQVIAVIAELANKNLQSDARFTESYINMRKNRGFGPLHIKAELEQRGVSKEIIHQYLYSDVIDWLEIAYETRRKKFGEEIPPGFVEQAKQKRYLQYKGFDFDLIKKVFSQDS